MKKLYWLSENSRQQAVSQSSTSKASSGGYLKEWWRWYWQSTPRTDAALRDEAITTGISG